MLKMIAAGSFALGCAGCFSTFDVAPKSLVVLNGYHEPQKVTMTDVEGESFVFDRGTELQFTGAVPTRAKFSAIQVNGPAFTGTSRGDGAPVALNIDQIMSVKAKKYSPLKTGLAIGIPVGVVTIVSIVGTVIILTQPQSQSTGDDGSFATAARGHGRRR